MKLGASDRVWARPGRRGARGPRRPGSTPPRNHAHSRTLGGTPWLAIVANPQLCSKGRVDLSTQPAHRPICEEEVNPVRMITIECLIDVIACPRRVAPCRPHDVIDPDVVSNPRHGVTARHPTPERR